MRCPSCTYSKAYKHGKTTKGNRRYFCPTCQKTFTYRVPLSDRLSNWKRRSVQLFVAALSTYFILISPIGASLATQGLTQFLPTDSGSVVDEIVVLGRGNELRNSRVITVADLWHHNRASRIFASGMGDAPQIVKQLKSIGIPAGALEGEHCSQTTEENALFTAAILYPQGVRSILLVTDPAHMMRSLLVLQSFGFAVISHPSPFPQDFNSANKTYLALREYAALAAYMVLGRFQPHSPKQLESPEVTRKLSTWNCRIKR
jgi:uncharacterized SAM-binding protein YcdF (DUF218 family)